MPVALLDDPTSPLVYRMSGQGPYPTPENPHIPSSIFPRPVTLRDRVTIATLIPFFSPHDVPRRLLSFLCDNLNKEIEGGDTYPMVNPLPLDTFGTYWFGNFGAVMIKGDIGGVEAVNEMEQNGVDWKKLCLGSFYVKPNYPGRSSHVCNGGFITTQAARNKGVGKSMGQCYLDWAPQLGYTYSVFNLVYETNTASTKIWDSLGFKRIGRVPDCGHLKSSAEPVDAIIYGRDLKAEGESVLNEERFDKIRYYLRHLSYPQGADRSEKSRLRSAATHYKLVGGTDGTPEKLMLKDKEVISDPNHQYEIAKETHLQTHGGINKTTAMIATKYHWVRIKETVSHVIKNCAECKESTKAGTVRSDSVRKSRPQSHDENLPSQPPLPQPQPAPVEELQTLQSKPFNPNDFLAPDHLTVDPSLDPTSHEHDPSLYTDMDIDPQILEQLQAQIASGEFQAPDHDFVPNGLPQYVDTDQLQHHNPNGFDVGPNGHGHVHAHAHDQQAQFFQQTGNPSIHPHSADHSQHLAQGIGQDMGGAMAEQMMGDGSGLNNMQSIQHVLHLGDYVNGHGDTTMGR
ncbi:hypothetical protein DV735_g3136, partial [Chaetothyriales sp. CBS 134920]